MDRLTASQRSNNMAQIRSKDTKPEKRVRSIAHAMGLRYRLHRSDLKGKPDLVFPKYRIAIFVHGCFWHQHPCCKRAALPKTHIKFWKNKLNRNIERDSAAIEHLQSEGWRVEVIWECETKNPLHIQSRLERIFFKKRPKRTKAKDL